MWSVSGTDDDLNSHWWLPGSVCVVTGWLQSSISQWSVPGSPSIVRSLFCLSGLLIAPSVSGLCPAVLLGPVPCWVHYLSPQIGHSQEVFALSWCNWDVMKLFAWSCDCTLIAPGAEHMAYNAGTLLSHSHGLEIHAIKYVTPPKGHHELGLHWAPLVFCRNRTWV